MRHSNGPLWTRRTLRILCVLLPAWGFAPSYSEPDPANQFHAFIPAGWDLRAVEKGDLNGDSIKDAVLILEQPGSEEGDRLVYILEGTRTGFQTAAKAPGIAYCMRCGGAFGDPFEDPDITRGVLSIHNYGGSAVRWGHTYSFAKIDGAYRLISYDFSTFRSAEECTEAGMHYNVRTGIVQLSRDKMKQGDVRECLTTEETVKAPVRDLLIEDQASWNLPGESSFDWFFRPAEK